LCCVATSFDASEDFAIDKPAGVACPHLTPDRRCGIHDRLVLRGFRGCAVYGCHGAGQRVTRAFAGRPGAGRERDEAFMVLRVVHELLWLLTEAAKLCPPSHAAVLVEIAREVDALDRLAESPPIPDAGLEAHREAAHAILRRVGDALGGRPSSRERPCSR
jgi:hypothetical protein